ncbi:MAG: transcription elongation factor GreA [Anaerolineae bacterium]|jgi:transcription elongation factor GreA|nr:transcription elongation factor GreA [Anaerolineae bacterium]
MADEQFLTADGAAELRQELEDLIKVKRPALAQRLKEAIGQGDLSENADYIDAKEQQGFLEGRIQYLENLLRHATIIEEADDGKGTPYEVKPGCTVTVVDEEGIEDTYRVVGPAEADPRNGKISNESPMGVALLGRRLGDRVRVHSPGGDWQVKITRITR